MPDRNGHSVAIISGVLWQGSRLLSVENSNFPYFSVSSTFQHEIWHSAEKMISMTVLKKIYSDLCLFITAHAQNKQFL